jgi:hypothetical protein
MRKLPVIFASLLPAITAGQTLGPVWVGGVRTHVDF